jgi:hypothetical protein
MLGQIRLNGGARPLRRLRAVLSNHIVVEPLTAIIREFALSRAHFDRLIDARADLAKTHRRASQLEDYAEAPGKLFYLALEVLGVHDPAAGEAGSMSALLIRSPGCCAQARIGRRFIGRYSARPGSPAGYRTAWHGLRAATAELRRPRGTSMPRVPAAGKSAFGNPRAVAPSLRDAG